MTKEEALYAFFSGFGLPAYVVGGVPDGASLPYLTYEPAIGQWGSETAIGVSLWYGTEEEQTPNAKAAEIGRAIGSGGTWLHCSEGAVWLKQADTWCTSPDLGDGPARKRRDLNVTAEYLTQN